MFLLQKAHLAPAILLSFVSIAITSETPFMPYKDGHATTSTYTGNSRTLVVRSDSKAWISHAFLDGTGIHYQKNI